MSNNWYIVDVSGDTQGPMDETQLIVLYMNEMIHSKTYIWNGQSVTEWLPIKDVAFIYDKIKDHYINSYEELHCPEPVGPTPTPKKKGMKSFSHDDVHSKLERRSIEQELDAVIPYILESATPKKSNHANAYHQANENAFGNNEENSSNDENITGRHINIPQYPSTLKYLSRDSDRNDLMANIRNGINLRDKECAQMKQNIYKLPPKRLKDSFQATAKNEHQNVEFPLDYVQELHGIKHSYQSTKRKNKLSLETPIDPNLISDVERNGLHRQHKRKHHKSNKQFTPMQPSNVKLPFCNEVAEKASLIRERFGEVEIASGHGRKEYAQQNETNESISKQMKYTLKSSQMANRIARIKHELDQLTDSESWIVTRIENVLFNANR